VKNKLNIGLIDVVLLLIGLIPILVALLHYSKLPAQMITHIEINGEINRLFGKKVALSIMSIITLSFPIVFKATRNSDPKSDNSFKLENLFELMRVCIAILLSYLFLLTILFNLGYYNGFKNWGIPLVGVLFIVFGNLLNRFRFNYSFGIRTPWTLSSEEVWRRTHHFSGPVFIGAGLLLLFAIIFKNPFWIILASFIIIVLVPTGYSYLISREINRPTQNPPIS
jgi:uncharacterized membrane protein